MKELKLYKKITRLTERKKEQACFQYTISWQRSGGIKLGSAAVALSLTAQRQRLAWQGSCTARCDQGMVAPAANSAVLPLHAATVAMKTPAGTAIAGAQTINNQLKAWKQRR